MFIKNCVLKRSKTLSMLLTFNTFLENKTSFLSELTYIYSSIFTVSMKCSQSKYYQQIRNWSVSIRTWTRNQTPDFWILFTVYYAK